MSQAQARTYALALPESTLGEHHGRLDIRVRNKIFVTLPPDETLVLKVLPENLSALVELEPETFKRVWGDRWVLVELANIELKDLHELILDSWRLAAPKRLAKDFDGG